MYCNNKLIILGLKINKNIDIININTKKIKREKNFSDIIYEELKIITLPETNLTNLIKYNAVESIMKVK